MHTRARAFEALVNEVSSYNSTLHCTTSVSDKSLLGLYCYWLQWEVMSLLKPSTTFFFYFLSLSMATEKLAGSCRATGLLDWWSTARPMDLKTILYSELSTVLFICKEMARDGQSQDLQWYEERILERWTPNFWSTCTLGDHGWSHVNVACASLSMRIHMYMYIVIINWHKWRPIEM